MIITVSAPVALKVLPTATFVDTFRPTSGCWSHGFVYQICSICTNQLPEFGRASEGSVKGYPANNINLSSTISFVIQAEKW